jgi:tripeptide aminopeptidase
MNAFVREVLADCGVRILEDGAGAQFGGQCGNLICLPPQFDHSAPAMALLAHLDTPLPTTGVRPQVHHDRITSDGSTILGVDNRAGVTALLFLLLSTARERVPANFLVVFTIAEELGMYGSKHLDLRPYHVRRAFVFDCSKRPGTFIQSAVGCSLFHATFRGRSSHAGVHPEQGINAIQIAAQALTGIRMGRLGPAQTANVGVVKGGSATNVVPDACMLEGEVRAFEPEPIREYLEETRAVCRRAAEARGGSVDFSSEVDFAPFRLSPDAAVFRETVRALESVGLQPHPIEYLGGSDANMLNAAGVPAVNLGIGAQNPHGRDEFILLEDLTTTVRVATALVQRGVSDV